MNNEYYIYGLNRVAKDFVFFFEDISIRGFIRDADEEIFNEFMGKPVWGIEALQGEKKRIIVCDFDCREKQKTLDELGYIEGIDYFMPDYYIDALPQTVIPENLDIVIWGTGIKAEDFLLYFNKEIAFFIDNYNYGTVFHGKKVVHPDSVESWNNLFVIVAVKRDASIIDQIKTLGIDKENVISYKTILQSPAYLLKRTMFDRRCFNMQCDTMTNHLEISGTDATCCCTTFVSVGMGDIVKQGYSNIWNNTVHRILSLSTQNQTYSFCKTDVCPLFKGKSEFRYPLDKEYKKIEDGPRVLSAGFDATCNLKCETCRKDYKILNEEEKKRVEDVKNIIINDVLKHLNFIILAGEGEIFASRACRDIYTNAQTKNIKYFRILTNGLLFTKEKWDEFIRNKGETKILLTVSVDAATKDTYEQIRRGGDFKTLLNNLKLASELRKTGRLSYYRINFVVQRRNYTEMKQFVELGEKLGVDEVFFTRVLNWGTYTNAEFEEISMMERDGITPKRDLKLILDDPIMKEEVVDIGTIRTGEDVVVSSECIYNYYMWEIERKIPDIFS